MRAADIASGRRTRPRHLRGPVRARPDLAGADRLFRAERRRSGASTMRHGGGMAANAAVTVARLGGDRRVLGPRRRRCRGHEMRSAFRGRRRRRQNSDYFEGRSSVSGIIVDQIRGNGRSRIFAATLPRRRTGFPWTRWRARRRCWPIHAGLQGAAVLFEAAREVFRRCSTGRSPMPRSSTPAAADRSCSLLCAGAGLFRRPGHVARPWRVVSKSGCGVAPSRSVSEASTGRGDRAVGKPAFPVEVIDTTGAGDVFHGAYALAIAPAMGCATPCASPRRRPRSSAPARWSQRHSDPRRSSCIP